MRTVEITYELTYRISKSYEVTDEEYQDIHDGALPARIEMELIDEADVKGDTETDWTAVDHQAEKVLQGWSHA